MDDLADIMDEVMPLAPLYYVFGRALRLSTADLRAIRDTYENKPDVESALEDVLLLWLNKKYNVDKFGLPTWKMIVEAVARQLSGNSHKLAMSIASRHPAG